MVVAVHVLVHVFENGIPFSTPVQSLEQTWLSCWISPTELGAAVGSVGPIQALTRRPMARSKTPAQRGFSL